MLLISTYVGRSAIEGMGCFAGRDIAEGEVVWALYDKVDRVSVAMPYIGWERRHGYLSHTQAGRFILPRDNAAFLNFAEDPNLKEGHLSEGEPVLVAARAIAMGEELTVPFSSDADAEWKMRAL